ncbi:ABC transporter permease [Alkalibacillus haloalkaliphilus]|uniref:ABC transporter permease n=1 Tax=Alkalibacillus haloalkaliphilus TaxID=94136 RepID=UPI0002EB1524|nr:ABC transporter permease [Alkalibacillus haloalkaliphilus]
MWTFLIKDLLLFWRDRKEVAIIILLPLALVVILSLVMPGMFGEGSEEEYDLDLALVKEDDQERSLELFEDHLRQTSDLSNNEIEELLIGVRAHLPVEGLIEYLNSPELAEWVSVEAMEKETAQAEVEQGNLDGALIIPEDYSFQLLADMYLNEPTEQALSFQADDQTMEVEILSNVIQSYLDHMNLHHAISSAGGEVEVPSEALPQGQVENVEGQQSFSMDQYFTISMGALFVLFLAATVATRTGIEKRENTFKRIVLTNSPPLYYLFGKTMGTFILAWCQMMLILIGSHLILGVFSDHDITVWVGLILMATMYALAIAAISAVMTSVMLRLKNSETGDGIFMMVIMVFGVIGGNFVPIYLLPNWLQQIGEMTPNGLVLATLIEWIQYEDFSILVMPTVILMIIVIVSLFIGVKLYPKRGDVS